MEQIRQKGNKKEGIFAGCVTLFNHTYDGP